uniref:Uncharacterized protein n=1 Tax=Arundo donax TaxID=35708 RepID=A0A0A8ZWQ8_ARUDO
MSCSLVCFRLLAFASCKLFSILLHRFWPFV